MSADDRPEDGLDEFDEFDDAQATCTQADVNPAIAPGHVDLIVSPEAIDAAIEADPSGIAIIDTARAYVDKHVVALPGLGAPLNEAEAQAHVEAGGAVQHLLPADRLVEEGHEGELVIFDDADVRQALKQFEAGGGYHKLSKRKRLEAMRGVMMFALSIAAFNLDVKP